MSSWSNTGYIMMYDVNIEEETKCENSVLALSLFSIRLWTRQKLSYDQIDAELIEHW